jgi:hypothetical protein
MGGGDKLENPPFWEVRSPRVERLASNPVQGFPHPAAFLLHLNPPGELPYLPYQHQLEHLIDFLRIEMVDLYS